MNAPVPEGYILSKIFTHRSERVYIYTDGANYIFAYGLIDNEMGQMWHTLSEPAKIGNAPL